jgi:hypothetical protein
MHTTYAISRTNARRLAWTLAVPMILAWPVLSAGDARALQFSEARIFFELNATDRDVGVHVALDAQSWSQVSVTGPNGRIIQIVPQGNLANIGLTELLFEGEEPSLDEVPFAQFLILVPAGNYIFNGMTTGGQVLRSSDKLTTAIPCPVEIVSPPEDEEAEADPLVISWEPAPGTFNPDTGNCDTGKNVNLVGYQVAVGVEKAPGGLHRSFEADVPPGVTSLTVSPEFLEGGSEYKVEVLAIEASGNKTITEREFDIDG